ELGVSIVVHLLVVAEVARALGLRQSRSLGEDAYFAGLMHDFGKLALLRTLPLDYLRIAARCESHRIPALRAEEDLLAPSQPLLRNHVQTGAELLRAHGLPEELAVAIERHHDDPALHARDGAAWEVPCIVIIANQLAYFLGYSDGLREDNPAHVSPLDLMGLLGLEQDAFQGIVQEGMSRANDGIVAARLPLKPALMERIKEMGMGAVEPSSDREEDEEMTDDAYGICMTMIDLARSRPRIGFFDFKAHTGLETTTLLSYLDRFTENGYLKTVQADSSRVGYEATRKLHTERPHDILRNVVMDLVEHRPDDARGGEA
ncbi:MAG: HDOD domain-containing protein, partial [Candidatus Eisenbacteria sp.]|nr:HDOD domain-containing protein [Candidatus Eisenbacteria bacterium]